MKSKPSLFCATASATVCLLGLLTGCGGVSSSSSTVSTPTGAVPPVSTTLQAETSNNTSAANSFAGLSNGNASANNVSKQPISSLLYSGATTKIYAHWLGWFGQSSHINVGYTSDSTAEVQAQVQDMMSRGISGAIADWHGVSDTSVEAATQLLKAQAEASSGQFQFAIGYDKAALGAAAVSNGCDVTTQLISDLTYISSEYESSPAYMTVTGRPVVYFFDVDDYYIDWTPVLASVPGNPLVLLRGSNGFTTTTSNGGFSWVNIEQDSPFDPELNLQDSFFQAAQAVPQELTVAAGFKGFNDSQAAWGTNRVINQDCGQTWLQSFSEVGKYYSTSNQLPALQVVTWNDYEEGSEVETGIDNCVYLIPSQSGSTISWQVNGNENTVDHYTVYLSTDGQNLSDLTDVPNGTHSLDLSHTSLAAATTYFVFIKAVGVASMLNKMSPAIAYRTGDQPPAALLAVTQGSGLSYTASTSGSSGTVAKSVIDFGDGAVVTGASSTHTYASVGTYLITATVSDSAGASSVAVQQISAKPASSSSGVTISSPANNATVNWPTPIVASASSSSTVSSMQVLIDGVVAYATYGDTINTNVKINTGSHQVSVQSLDGSGNVVATASLTVVAEPHDISPIARITVAALPSISPTTVLACTAGSTDADGFVNSVQLNLSTGSIFTTPGALETFAASGSYTATATVTDNYGATNTTSTTFSIANGVVSSARTSTGNQAREDTDKEQWAEPIAPPQK